jgi:hypothetical protein
VAKVGVVGAGSNQCTWQQLLLAQYFLESGFLAANSVEQGFVPGQAARTVHEAALWCVDASVP